MDNLITDVESNAAKGCKNVAKASLLDELLVMSCYWELAA
jgi:hypothetical protein